MMRYRRTYHTCSPRRESIQSMIAEQKRIGMAEDFDGGFVPTNPRARILDVEEAALHHPVSMADVEEAYEKIRPLVKCTPLSRSYSISQIAGVQTFFKYENLQRTGSYKERGAANKLMSLSEDERAQGVVASSAGNHAQGLSYHSSRLGIDAKIVMPINTPVAKVAGTEQWGAKVVLHGESFDEAYAEAQRIAAAEGRMFVHAFNDPKIVAGQGTIALEILEQNPFIDAIIAPIGGGGLLAGIAAVVKQVNPRIKVYGVESANMPGMKVSVQNGKVTTVPFHKTLADGIAVCHVGDVPFQIIKDFVDDIVTVSEDEIAAAVLLLLEKEKTVVEGAGATSLAAVMSGKIPYLKNPHRRAALLLSGGNIDVTVMNDIISRGLVKTGRLVRLRVEVPDQPGELVRALQVISTQMRANIQEIEHERAFMNVPVGFTQTIVTIQTKGHDHVSKIEEALRSNGFKFTIEH